MVHTYPRFYFLNKKKWSLRSFLTFGYSLKHTYRIIRQFDNSFQNNEIEEYIEKMTDLRKQVIETRNVNEKVIFPLIELGINVSKIMLQKVDNIIVERIPFQPGKTDFMYIKSFEIILSFVTGSNSFELSKNEGVNILKLPHSYAIFILMPSGNGGLSSYQSKRIVGENSINLNEEKKELLELIEKPFAEYNSLFKNCKVFNGMSFELNTPYIWNTRKYNPSNLLDYARWFKHMVLNKKNEIKVSKIINTHNY